MKTKTNACRILDALGVSYELLEYTSNPEELQAVAVAHKLGLPPEQVFKTLVLTGDTLKYFVIVLPGDQELDLKKAARFTGNKSCALLPLQQLQPLTGYIRGGCSPIGMKKKFPTFLASSAFLYDSICVSSGVRGMLMLVAPDDLQRAVEAEIIDL